MKLLDSCAYMSKTLSVFPIVMRYEKKSERCDLWGLSTWVWAACLLRTTRQAYKWIVSCSGTRIWILLSSSPWICWTRASIHVRSLPLRKCFIQFILRRRYNAFKSDSKDPEFSAVQRAFESRSCSFLVPHRFLCWNSNTKMSSLWNLVVFLPYLTLIIEFVFGPGHKRSPEWKVFRGDLLRHYEKPSLRYTPSKQLNLYDR